MPCYESPTAAYLHDAEILKPVYVAPGVDEVRDVGEDTLAYLETEEGQALLVDRSQGHAEITSNTQIIKNHLQIKGRFLYTEGDRSWRGTAYLLANNLRR